MHGKVKVRSPLLQMYLEMTKIKLLGFCFKTELMYIMFHQLQTVYQIYNISNMSVGISFLETVRYEKLVIIY